MIDEGGGDAGRAQSAGRAIADPQAWRPEDISRAVALAAVAAVGLLLVLIGWAASVVGPLFLGLFIAALAAPLFDRLVGGGRTPAVGLAITIGLVVLIAGLLALLAVVSARELTDSLALYADELALRYPDSATLASLGVPEQLRTVIPPEALVQVLAFTASAIAEVGGAVAFAVVFAALLLLDTPRLGRLVASGLGSDNPVFRQAPAVAGAAVTYFNVRIRINAVTALGLLVLLLILGVDDAVLWAVGTFFLSFVPYLGLILALIPPTILGFAESGPLVALAVVIGGTVLNLIAENVLEPTMTGRALALSSWVVFAMFFFWVWLIGPVGALLSMPITVLIVLVLRENERTRWIASIMSRS